MGFDYKSLKNFHLFSLLFLICHTLLVFSQPTNNTITQGQFIRDGETIISSARVFELGFFSPENSASRYVGIWYYTVPIQTIVWVANRENPISGDSGVFGIGNNGTLVVSDGNGTVIWSSNNSSGLQTTNLTSILLDNGNFILSDGNNVGDESNALWQSYDHPTDTFLPEMRIPMNALEGENHSFFSWKSLNDPSTGNFSMGIDPRASPQIVTWNGSQRLWRSGHWNRLIFVGVPSMRSLLFYGFRITTEREGNMYFTFQGLNSSTLMNFRLGWDGIVQQSVWNGSRGEWSVALTQPSDECGEYNKCGNFGICSVRGTSQICSCLEGFIPNSTDEWNRGNWSGGCHRRTSLQCDDNGNVSDGFVEVKRVKLPDYADSGSGNTGDECEEECLRNCMCNSYAFVTGIGCMTWSGDLIDVEQFQEGGENLYIRVAKSELGGKSRTYTVTAVIISAVGAICLGVIMWLLWRFRGKLKDQFLTSRQERYRPHVTGVGRSQEISACCPGGEDELSTEGKQCSFPLFSFLSVEIATEYFSYNNKLGEGGFGPVYKGTFPGGQEIAVKRLSKLSGQGIEEFKNEMILIAKLQHRNLVRLLGCCIEREEKLLIYEYMPNKSLDSFLFDPIKKATLDWRTRFEIIEGIARGLLYLHRDSRLRIIHRDLKASNILLDEEMNPKISDFGMARIFGGKQNEANTNRVVGTYGYMSPEYAMEGLFSVKSDVYSFGVLLLEIVSGQRNNSFRSAECSNLIGYAWTLWKEGKAEEMVDSCIMEMCNLKEALKCVQVAMLCVQVSALHRPTMASVVVMLESENVSLPQPRQADLTSMSSAEMDLIMQGHDFTVSSNDVTISEVRGR